MTPPFPWPLQAKFAALALPRLSVLRCPIVGPSTMRVSLAKALSRAFLAQSTLQSAPLCAQPGSQPRKQKKGKE